MNKNTHLLPCYFVMFKVDVKIEYKEWEHEEV